MAASLIRGDVAVMAELAVASDVQDRGIGRRLLAFVMNRSKSPERFTLSSRERRAVGLNSRAGMTPRWPVYELRAERERRTRPRWRFRGRGGCRGRPGVCRLGRPCRHAPIDRTTMACVADEVASQPLWFRRVRTTVGYGFVVQRMAGEPKHSGTYRPGTAWAVADPRRFQRLRGRGVGMGPFARQVDATRRSTTRNQSLASLLAAGFRIVPRRPRLELHRPRRRRDALASYLPTFVEIY